MKGVGRETTRAGDGWYYSIHPRPCPLCPFAALDMGVEDSENKLAIDRCDLKLEVYRAHTQIAREIQKLREPDNKKYKLDGPPLVVSYNQKELEDPFGDDFSDLKLRKRFLTPLIKDFKTYSDALEPKGSTSERAEKVRALLVYDNETPEASLVNVGKPAEDDGEADQK